MTAKSQAAAKQVKDLAARVSDPKHLSKKEFKEFLDDLLSHFEAERDGASGDSDDDDD